MGRVCGRYVSAGDLADLSVLLGVNPFEPDTAAGRAPDEGPGGTDKARRDLLERRRFALAPTDPVPAVVPARPDGSRQLQLLNWGLVPPWAEVGSGAGRINARVETVLEKPSFRRAVRQSSPHSGRCLLPADGWYEWVRSATGRRLPHLIRPAGGGTIVFAGLYERVRRPDGTSLRTCSILTGPAPAPLAWLHERAPLVVPAELWADWLDPEADPAALIEALRRAEPEPMTVHPVSIAVNTVRNTGPELISPTGDAVSGHPGAGSLPTSAATAEQAVLW